MHEREKREVADTRERKNLTRTSKLNKGAPSAQMSWSVDLFEIRFSRDAL